MWFPFLLTNLHFTLNFIMGLVFFAIFWLQLDSWQRTRHHEELPKIIGILLVGISYLVEAVIVRTSLLPTTLGGVTILPLLVMVTRIPGYCILIVGLWREPLPQRPTTNPLTAKN